MKIFSYGICFLVFGTSLISCQKKSDPDPSQPTKADHISSAPWIYDNAGIDHDRNGTIDVALSMVAPNALEQCRIDNVLTFTKNNTGTTDEGATKCNGTDPQTTPFNWNFADNEANLTISNNVFTLLNGKSKIVSLTATNFTLSRDTTIGSISMSLVVTLKH